jgi:hypothetical protein
MGAGQANHLIERCIKVQTSSPRNGFAVIAGGTAFWPCLEGWIEMRTVRSPSFETLAEFIIGPRFEDPVASSSG